VASQVLDISIGAEQGSVLNAFMADRHSEVAIITGPLGSGKTFGVIQKLLALSMEQAPTTGKKPTRPTRWCIIRNTYPDLTTTIKDFLSVISEPEMGVMFRGVPPTFKGNFKMSDGTICAPEFVFLSLDREDHIKKLRGTQFTGAWLNETKELLKSVLDMITARVGRYPATIDGGVECSASCVLGDTNACDDDHWLYKLAEEQHPKNWTFYRQPGGLVDTGEVDHMGRKVFDLNPLAENVGNLPPRYYERVKEAKDDAWIDVNLCNEYGFYVDGKPVHPGYVDSIHCLPEDIEVKAGTLYIGVDFGRTPAAAIVTREEAHGRWVVIDEFVTEDMSAALFGPELKAYLDREYPRVPVRAWGDPAGTAKSQATEHTPIDVMKASGVPVVPAPSNEVTLRRAAVSRPLRENCLDGKPRLLICPKARMIRKGLAGGFAYKRMAVAGEERYSEEPNKNQYSHPVEALEYVLLGAGEYHATLAPPRADPMRVRSRQKFARRA
jgi:hypothetical protein